MNPTGNGGQCPPYSFTNPLEARTKGKFLVRHILTSVGVGFPNPFGRGNVAPTISPTPNILSLQLRITIVIPYIFVYFCELGK